MNKEKFDEALANAILLLGRGETNQGAIYLCAAVKYLYKALNESDRDRKAAIGYLVSK